MWWIDPGKDPAMNRHDMLYKWAFYAVASLLFILLQSLVFNRLCLLQTHPFVFPILTTVIAVLEPLPESFTYALVMGFLFDLTVPGVFPCFYTVTFLLIALLSTLIARKLIVPGFWCCMVCSALSIILCDIFNTLVLHYRHGTLYFDALRLMGRELLLSIILAPVVYLLFHQIHQRITQD